MPSERVQRRIDALLDRAEQSVDQMDWDALRELCDAVLRLDPGNEDAQTFLEAAGRDTGITPDDAAPTSASIMPTLPTAGEGRGEGVLTPGPTSFANDRYKVSKFLGEGGKKRVYQAHDTLLDREVAFALIKTEGFDQTSKERISREAQAMGRLGVHPNIVAVLDLGQEDDGTPYMVTELMGGGDVEGLLDIVGAAPRGRPGGGHDRNPETGQTRGPAPTTRGGLSLDRTIEIAKAVCEGLEFAHARGIVHRDLKPGNVWLTEEGAAKIGDFGLAVMTDRSRLTREGMMIGTVSYMPPEQATGGDITPKADLYSLGAMLYEMVTGRPPFLGDEEIAIIGQHINTPPVAPTWHNGDCPRPLEALVMRMLAKDPSERPDSAQDVYNALDAIDLAARGQTVEREANSLDSLAGGVFVGRQAEMDQLKGALEDVLGGRGRLVTLVGEPGIGKTRTSEELATYAGLRGAQVLWGRCYETGGQPPYWPWVQAIRSYVREIDPEELRRQMGSSASVVAEIVTDVKDRLPETGLPPQLDDPDSARFRLFDSITSFLKSASQSRPIVIVLDDLHWSDRPSLTFLEFMAREIGQSRVMLICTYRDMELNRRHPLTVTLGDLARERLYERVLLRGLTEQDIARFIEIAVGFTATAELSATVYRHTEGNPLFVTEVVRELVQSGELAENRVSGESTWSVRIPEGVREVIGRRLDRLSERANEVLTTAAVVGRDFRLNALEELTEDTTEGQLLDVLDEALDAKIIEELSDDIGHYQFTHALMQETLAGELSLTRRVRLHARIAVTLETLFAENLDAHAPELVHHFTEAETLLGSEKVVRYSLTAGKAALSSYGYEDAVRHFQKGIDSHDVRDETTAELNVSLAQALMHTSQRTEMQSAVDALIVASQIYQSAGSTPIAVIEALTRFPLITVQGTTGLIRLFEEAITHVEPDTTQYLDLIIGMAHWHRYETYDAEKPLELGQEAIEMARSAGDDVRELRALLGRDVQIGAQLLNVDSRDRLLELAERSDDLNAARRVFDVLGVYNATRQGDPNAAEEFFQKAISVAVKSRSAYSTAITYADYSQLLFQQGRFDEASAAVERGLTYSDTEIRLLVVRAWIAAITGDVDKCQESLDRLPELSSVFSMAFISRDVFLMFPYIGANWLTGVIEIPDKTIENARWYMAHDSELRGTWAALTAEWLGLAAVLRNNSDEVATQYEYALARPAPLGPRYQSGTWLGLPTRAVMASTLGRYDEAETHFEEALEIVERWQSPVMKAFTSILFAEMLLDRTSTGSAQAEPGDREKAIELQDEALAITQELGMRPLTERILARREILRA